MPGNGLLNQFLNFGDITAEAKVRPPFPVQNTSVQRDRHVMSRGDFASLHPSQSLLEYGQIKRSNEYQYDATNLFELLAKTKTPLFLIIVA